MAKKYALFIALILVVSYFSLTSGSFLFVLLSCSPLFFKSTRIRSMKFCCSI
ncbi:iron-uptake protein [Bacillus subtilis]|nr:iron-uptake protein [Bacillus subtilis]